jgi:hypothetical protein
MLILSFLILMTKTLLKLKTIVEIDAMLHIWTHFNYTPRHVGIVFVLTAWGTSITTIAFPKIHNGVRDTNHTEILRMIFEDDTCFYECKSKWSLYKSTDCYKCCYYYCYYYSSLALCRALAAFSVSWSYTQLVGLLGRGISPSQGLYLHIEQHKHKINAQQYRELCLVWDSNPRSSVRASEGSSFLIICGHCGRLNKC